MPQFRRPQVKGVDYKFKVGDKVKVWEMNAVGEMLDEYVSGNYGVKFEYGNQRFCICFPNAMKQCGEEEYKTLVEKHSVQPLGEDFHDVEEDLSYKESTTFQKQHSSQDQGLPSLDEFLEGCQGKNGKQYFVETLRSNGIDQKFPFDKENFEKLKAEYKKSSLDEKFDWNNYSEEYFNYKKSLPFFKRVMFWKTQKSFSEEIVNKEVKYSDKTLYLESMVKLGSTLNNTIEKVLDIVHKIEGNTSRLEDLVKQESNLEINASSQIQKSRKEQEEIINLRNLYESLQNYNTLTEEQKQEIKSLIKEQSENFPNVGAIDIREYVISNMLHGPLLLAEQLAQSRKADMDVLADRLDSTRNKINRTKKSQAELWNVYHPAIRALTKLHNRYEEMSLDFDAGFVVSDVSHFVGEINVLCQESQRVENFVQYKKEEEIKDRQNPLLIDIYHPAIFALETNSTIARLEAQLVKQDFVQVKGPQETNLLTTGEKIK